MKSILAAIPLLLGASTIPLLAACSGDATSRDTGAGGTSSTGTTTGTGAGELGGFTAGTTTTNGFGGAAPGEWVTLIDGTWELPSGTEGYWCVTRTFTEDVFIHGFRPKAPTGTHHTLLLTADGIAPDKEYPCGPILGHEMFFASGVGTDDLVFPDGVAVRIPAGTQLELNLHLYNTGADTLTGVSGTLVQLLPAADVEQEAEMVLPGTMSFSLPPHSTASAESSCSFAETSTVVALWPHMHQYGTHMTVTHEGAAGSVVVYDAPFTFTEQEAYAIDPLVVSGGESVGFVCTWDNPTDQTIGFGDSTDAEMCFLGLYRYPPLQDKCGLQ